MIYNLATPEQPGFSYLYLFKEDWRPSMADECKESPTVRRVVEIVIQNPNLHKEMLADYKVKAIRFDEMKTFTIEIPPSDDWEPSGDE
ncbi:8928_t:CDS:1, partial [Scutellospora calospora]